MKFVDLIRARLVRRSLTALAALLVLWTLAWLIVPTVLKSQLETRLGTHLGREVQIGGVDFKPWSLELTLHDLVIAQVGQHRPQLSIKRIYANAEAQSLLRLAPVIDALEVDAPELHLRHQGAGRYDIDDVVARLKPDSNATATDPMRFALYNLVLTQGAITLDDTPQGKVHQLKDLTIRLPFLSNIASERQVKVQPQLAFKINGSAFDSGAVGTPFADVHQSVANFSLKQLDLAPYLGYWPASLPLQLNAAVLDAELKLSFEQAAKTSVRLSGQVSASQVQLSAPGDKTNAPLLGFEKLSVQLSDVRPLERSVQLGQVDWVKPSLQVQRDAQGALNWQTLLMPRQATSVNTKSIARSADQERAAGQNDAKSPPWRVDVAQVLVHSAELHWLDQSTPKPAQLALQGLDLSAQALQWPITRAVPFEGQGQLEGSALSFKGQASDQAAELSAQLKQLPLSLAAPYLAEQIKPVLNGLLSVDLALNWENTTAKAPMRLALRLPELTLDSLVLTEAVAHSAKVDKAERLASIQQLQLRGGEFDLIGQTAQLGEIQVKEAKAALVRHADGRWMFQDWQKNPAPPANSPAKPWTLALKQLKLSGSQVAFADASPSRPVALLVDELSVQIKDLATTGATPFTWSLAARLRHGESEPGHLSAQGSTALNPLTVKTQLSAKGLPLLATEPYWGDALKVRLVHGQAGFNGRVDLANVPQGWATQLRGDVSVQDLRANTLPGAEVPAEELLSWRELALTGLDLALTPGETPKIHVAQTDLSDFFAKLTLTEAGRLNLQDVKPGAEDQSNKVAASTQGESATTTNDQNSSAAPIITFGPISMARGRVDFTDRFIKPNYSARLTELTGTLGGFSSQPVNGAVQLADLSLRGRAEGTATLALEGKVNPLARPLALDITGRVRDLELAPLSPYAARYAGYGIERGKLSIDIGYKVLPDGQLNADHAIVLNQLKFGDAVAGAQNSLPVKLAVALLADSQGVIDINLPVSGSLNDPQFRLAPLIFKVLGNLLMKAITAPFTLLASALGGGGDELSMVAFEPGTATLGPEAQAQLDKVAKALTARPALKMTVTGTASLALEADAYRRAQLNALLLAEKRTRLPQAAENPTAVTEAERTDLLKAAYKRADFAKPRNLIGLAKDLPAPEMEALLLANLAASESAMQALAVQRGVVVRDYLASLKLPLSRLFLGAAKAVAPEAKWRPRAELSLASE